MNRWTKYILIALILGAVFVWYNVAKSPTADENINDSTIIFCDVGQGDAVIIGKGNYQILVDGGPDDSVLTCLGKHLPVWDRQIEMVILTHPHADHLTGLRAVLSRYEVGEVYYSGVDYDSNGYLEFKNILDTKKIPAKIPKIGDLITTYENATLTFLWPGERYNGQKIENINNTSEVLRFCYFSHCALLTGDIETDAQKEMISTATTLGLGLGAEMLKLPHHGSVNGADQNLLDAVKPVYAIISVGADNKYGHPHAAVIVLLTKNNIRILRTDRDGTIRFNFSETGMTKK